MSFNPGRVAPATLFDLAFLFLVLLIDDAQCRHSELYFMFQAVTVVL